VDWCRLLPGISFAALNNNIRLPGFDMWPPKKTWQTAQATKATRETPYFPFHGSSSSLISWDAPLIVGEVQLFQSLNGSNKQRHLIWGSVQCYLHKVQNLSDHRKNNPVEFPQINWQWYLFIYEKNRSSYNSNHSWTSRGCTNKYTINEVLPGPSNSPILGDLATMRQGTKELFTSVNGPLILLWSNSSTLGSHGTGMFSWWSSWRSCTRNAHDTSLSCLA